MTRVIKFLVFLSTAILSARAAPLNEAEENVQVVIDIGSLFLPVNEKSPHNDITWTLNEAKSGISSAVERANNKLRASMTGENMYYTPIEEPFLRCAETAEVMINHAILNSPGLTSKQYGDLAQRTFANIEKAQLRTDKELQFLVAEYAPEILTQLTVQQNRVRDAISFYFQNVLGVLSAARAEGRFSQERVPRVLKIKN